MKKRTSFKNAVLEAVKEIPRGQVLSYREVARRAGRSRAYRAVGNILNRCRGMRKGIPCHRVVRSDGRVGGYRWGNRKKAELLRQEKAI